MVKKRKSSLLIKGIMLLLALIIMIFVASLAWFTPPDRPVTAEGLSVNATAGKQFDVAIGFKTSANGYQYTMSQYTKDLSLRDIITTDGTHYDVLHDFSPVDITGDGVTLVRPSMQLKNVDIDRNSVTFTTVSPNKEYICFDMYFKSEEPCKVYLDSGSFVKGAIEETAGDGNLIQTSDTGDNRKSADGNFSKDAIVGAVRVSFVNYDQFIEGEDNYNRQDTAQLLWLPRPDIHLNARDEAGDDIDKPWTLSTGLTPETSPYDTVGATDRFGGHRFNTFTHHYYSYALDDNGIIIGDADYKGTITNPSRNAICDVSYKSGGYYYGKTQVNIWIEGCDAEARRTMAGGQFQINFDLAGS